MSFHFKANKHSTRACTKDNTSLKLKLFSLREVPNMPHSLPKPAFFSILVILALHQVKVHGKNISIIRGEKDVFTNLAECRLAKAVCFDTNCTNCQCKGLNETYVQRRGKYGECVRNEYFAYATGKWLVYVSALGLCRGFLYFLDCININAISYTFILSVYILSNAPFSPFSMASM